MNYDSLHKKNFLYKTRLAKKNPVTRGDSAILIPKDRPQPESVSGIGQTIIENYWSKSEDRWIMRLTGPLPDKPASLLVTYKGGGKESFRIDSLSGRTEYEPGPYKGRSSDPGKPLVAQPPAQSTIELPSSYAGKVGLVAIVQGRKFTPCIRDPANPARWTHAGRKASKYGVRWNERPGGSVAVFNGASLGLWSITDGKRFFTLAEIVAEMLAGQVQPPPANPPPVVPPVPPTKPPNPTAPGNALFSTTPNSITLRDDFAAAAGKIDALTGIQDPHGPGKPASPSSVAIQAVRSGNTWTLPESLAAYPKGNVPNTWRIRLNKTPPAGVTYHTSINQSFVRVGDNPYGPGNKTYPPTTRK